MILTRFLMIVLPVLAVLLQSGCATRLSPAPVVDRSSGRSAEPVEPGYYRIKRGDTLLRIALDHGQSHRDIAEWNNIADPNLIEVDQVIRITPPKSTKTASTKIEVKQEKPAIVKEAPKPVDKQPNKEEKLAKQEVVPEKAKSDAPADLGIRLSWPSKGEVIERFD